jgi:hypothetical protein
VSFPIFNQCINDPNLDGVEISDAEVKKNFEPSPESVFHRQYAREPDFKRAFFQHIRPILEEAQVWLSCWSHHVQDVAADSLLPGQCLELHFREARQRYLSVLQH